MEVRTGLPRFSTLIVRGKIREGSNAKSDGGEKPFTEKKRITHGKRNTNKDLKPGTRGGARKRAFARRD